MIRRRIPGLGTGMLLGLIALSSAPPAHAQSAPQATPPAVRVDVDPPQPAASDDAAALAAKLQNPIADLISVPFQNNTNFNVGPHRGVQNILNIQPVIPIHVSDGWNVVTRMILPVTWSPSYQPGASVPPVGLGLTSFSAFLSPRQAVNGWTWGVGPIFGVPTITNKYLGSNVWGAGPAVVAVRMARPWVYGVLVNNLFSLGGTSGRGGTAYSVMTINPFINYNFGGGWFVGAVPILTADWDSAGEKWTLPVGIQGGRLIKIAGKLPVNLVVGAYYNALRPSGAGTWQLRTQIAFIF